MSSAVVWSRTRERIKERSWLASVSQICSTVAVMLLAACGFAACACRFDSFDGGGDDIIGGVPAGGPGADEVAAGGFRTDADVFEARSAQDVSELFHTGGSGDTAAQRGEIGCQLGWKVGGAHDVGDGETPAWLENAEGIAEDLRLVGREI